jgi:hypothetical protein
MKEFRDVIKSIAILMAVYGVSLAFVCLIFLFGGLL